MARDLTPAALGILETLVGFDTTSRGSNLELIGWVEAYLDRHGVPHRRVLNAEGDKSNLLATIGPAEPGGVVEHRGVRLGHAVEAHRAHRACRRLGRRDRGGP